MKVRIDGPKPEMVVTRCTTSTSQPVFVALDWCKRLLHRYQADHGCSKSACKKDLHLPRRNLQRGERPGLASFRRKRKRELDELEVERGGSDVEALEQATRATAAERQTSKQMDMAMQLRKYVKLGVRQAAFDCLAAGSGPDARKLEEYRKEAEKVAKRIAEIQRPTLAQCMQLPPLASTTVFLFSENHTVAQQKLEGLGASVFVWPASEAAAVQLGARILEADSLCWVAVSPSSEKELFMEPDKSTFAACARFMGGACGSMEWLNLVENTNKLCQPVARLERAIGTATREICIHKSSQAHAHSLSLCMAAAQKCGLLHGWTLRRKWQHMQLACGLFWWWAEVVWGGFDEWVELAMLNTAIVFGKTTHPTEARQDRLRHHGRWEDFQEEGQAKA